MLQPFEVQYAVKIQNTMGKIKQGLLGGVSGKVGPIVGSSWKSINYIRTQAAKVSNPRTEKQQKQRGKFTIAFSFLKSITPFIRIGYKNCAQEKTPFNAAMSYILRKAITGNGTEMTIEFNRVLVCTGNLMPIFEGTATKDSGKMLFRWKDNSGTGNAETNDIAMILVYNKDKNEAVYDISAATRADTYAEQNLPDRWLNDELFSYLGFMSIEGDTVSNSVCLPPDLPVFPKNR